MHCVCGDLGSPTLSCTPVQWPTLCLQSPWVVPAHMCAARRRSYRNFCLRFKYLLPLSDRAIVRATSADYRQPQQGKATARVSEVLGAFGHGFARHSVDMSRAAMKARVVLSDENWRTYIAAIFAHSALAGLVSREE